MTSRQEWGWRDYLAIGLAVAALLAAVIAVTWQWVPWRTIFSDQGLAAWVQAIGSVVAIAIAIAMPAMQHRADREREAEARRSESARVLGIAAQMGGSALSLLVTIAERRGNPAHGESQDERQIQRQAMTDILRLLEGVSPLELPNPEASSCVLSMRYALNLALGDLDTENKNTVGGSARRREPWLAGVAMFHHSIEGLAEQMHHLGEAVEFRDPTLMERAIELLQADPEFFADFESKRKQLNTRTPLPPSVAHRMRT